jgi:succinate dehydrogenase / fumarate reductase, cytochrome b subunit
MSWLLKFWDSTVGKKVVMAATGILLLGFVFAHMAGNLQMFIGADAMNRYAAFLKSTGELLWVARLGLLGAVVLHIIAAVQLTRLNAAARPQEYAKREPQVSTLASRTMRWGGFLLLFFIVFHIGHFTTGTFHPAFSHTGVYGNVILGFRSPWVVAFYVTAMAALGLHLFHGAWAAFRTLGLQKRSASPLQRSAALWFAIIVWAGFTVIPLAVLLGILN